MWFDTRVALHEFLANLLVRPYNLMEMFIGTGPLNRYYLKEQIDQ